MLDSLYIHIPYCLSKCKYCDFFSVVTKEGISDSYVNALCNEISYRLKSHNVDLLTTVYIGGGTPSLLSEEQLFKILDSITKVTKISKSAEVTIEVNPDDITPELLTVYKKSYINRISCGIQSLNNKSLEFCGRRADVETNLRALKYFTEHWDKELSLDIICGLPYDDFDTFTATLKTIIDNKPGHISMYSLTVEPETPLGEMVTSGELEIDYDYSDELWLKGYEILKQAGYNQYEVSNFCLTNKESRHNTKYWQHSDYIGCGSGATGTVYNTDGSGTRWTNKTDIHSYIDFWNDKKNDDIPQLVEQISIDDSKFEFFMMGLRKRSGIKKSEYFNIFGECIPEEILSIFSKWKNRNLLEIESIENDIVYYLNEKGILFLNNLLEELI